MSAGGLFVLEGIIRPVVSVLVPVYISAGGLFVLDGIIRPVVSVLVPVYISFVIFNIEIYNVIIIEDKVTYPIVFVSFADLDYPV